MKRSTLLITLLTLLSAGNVLAGEFQVRAPVVDVEPITEPAMEVEHCADQPSAHTLSATLAWDLGLNCQKETIASDRVTGYRVFYRWDDRVYSQVMSAAPGATVALKVRVD